MKRRARLLNRQCLRPVSRWSPQMWLPSSGVYLFIEECICRIAHSFPHIGEDAKRLGSILGFFSMLAKRLQDFEGNSYVVRRVMNNRLFGGSFLILYGVARLLKFSGELHVGYGAILYLSMPKRRSYSRWRSISWPNTQCNGQKEGLGKIRVADCWHWAAD